MTLGHKQVAGREVKFKVSGVSLGERIANTNTRGQEVSGIRILCPSDKREDKVPQGKLVTSRGTGQYSSHTKPRWALRSRCKIADRQKKLSCLHLTWVSFTGWSLNPSQILIFLVPVNNLGIPCAPSGGNTGRTPNDFFYLRGQSEGTQGSTGAGSALALHHGTGTGGTFKITFTSLSFLFSPPDRGVPGSSEESPNYYGAVCYPLTRPKHVRS